MEPGWSAAESGAAVTRIPLRSMRATKLCTGYQNIIKAVRAAAEMRAARA
jgi:aerobic-type carbon monoxide dehydrogenase small subunit (CoxS/CutS family)